MIGQDSDLLAGPGRPGPRLTFYFGIIRRPPSDDVITALIIGVFCGE